MTATNACTCKGSVYLGDLRGDLRSSARAILQEALVITAGGLYRAIVISYLGV